MIDLRCATTKSAKSKAFTLNEQMVKSNKRENTYGTEKDDCAQNDTHRPQDGTEGCTR